MKTGLIYFFLFGFVMCITHVSGQSDDLTNVCFSASSFCSADLRQPVFTSVLTTDAITYGKSGTASSDVSYIKDVNDNTGNYCNASQGSDVICRTDNYNQNLVYKVYYPQYNNYNTCPLPAVVFVHGGGFSDCSGYDGSDLASLCNEFALRGFVVFNVEYRRGRIKDDIDDQYASVQQELSIYRAVQDVRGALRSILKRQLLGETTYKFDTSKLFLAGNSAGSVAVLFAAYYPYQSQMNQIFLKDASSSYNIQQALGNIDADYYYGEPIASLSYQQHIKGILNMWGSMYFPRSYYQHYSDFFTQYTYNLPPVISFCGRQDQVFDWKIQPVLFPPTTLEHSEYRTESNCLVSAPYFTLQALNNAPPRAANLINLGSKFLYDSIFKKLGIPAEFYLDCQMHHGLDNDCITCNFQSDFGTGLTSTSDVYKYIVQRACTFFQLIMGGNPSALGKTEFVECENYRNKCNTSNNYNTSSCQSSCN